MRSIANQNAREGAMVNLRVVGWDKGESLATNFTKVGNGQFTTKPKFRGCFTAVAEEPVRLVR